MTGTQDTQQALADIDRKLRELQQALAQVSESPPPPSGFSNAEFEGGPSEPTRDPALPAPSPPPPALSSGQGEELVEQAAGLAGQLERHIGVLRNLQSELERSTRELAEAFRRGASPGAAEGVFQGVVMIDVGPFADIGTLGTFEHVLAGLGVADDVHVRSYEGSRALVHVRLHSPTALVEEMRRALPFAFEVTAASDQELTVQLHPAADHG